MLDLVYLSEDSTDHLSSNYSCTFKIGTDTTFLAIQMTHRLVLHFVHKTARFSLMNFYILYFSHKYLWHPLSTWISCWERRKEGNVLFNDTPNTFYLQLCGVKDHSDSERGNLLHPLDVVHFLISSKGSFICAIPDMIVHITAFITPVVEHWQQQEIAQ